MENCCDLYFLQIVETLTMVLIDFGYVRKTAKKKKTINFVMSVRLSAWNISAPTGRIFIEFYIWLFLENTSTKFRYHSNPTRITGTVHDDQYKFFNIRGISLISS